MNIDISIVIPSFNSELSITRTLDSLLKQTYINFEAIIIDDGSTDNTASIVKEYTAKDNRFKYMFQTNSGVSAARNRGTSVSIGTYICFLDSDDFYEETFLERMFSKISLRDSDVCYCGYYRLSSAWKKKAPTMFKEGNILLDFVFNKIMVQTTGWMIKRQFLNRNNLCFCEGVSWGEDFEFFCYVLAHTDNVTYVCDYLTNYDVSIESKNYKLSSYSIEKIDLDYDAIMRILNHEKICANKKVVTALLDYRLNALITYRLFYSFNNGISKETIHKYNDKYKKYINRFSYSNNLRSVKLNLTKVKLLYLCKICNSL